MPSEETFTMNALNFHVFSESEHEFVHVCIFPSNSCVSHEILGCRSFLVVFAQTQSSVLGTDFASLSLPNSHSNC